MSALYVGAALAGWTFAAVTYPYFKKKQQIEMPRQREVRAILRFEKSGGQDIVEVTFPDKDDTPQSQHDVEQIVHDLLAPHGFGRGSRGFFWRGPADRM